MEKDLRAEKKHIDKAKFKNKIQKKWIETSSKEYVQDDVRIIDPETGKGQVYTFNKETLKFEVNKKLDCWELQRNKWWKSPNIRLQAIQRSVKSSNDVFKTFMEESDDFQKCTQCSRWIEKGGGCNHMQCICGYKFNWQ